MNNAPTVGAKGVYAVMEIINKAEQLRKVLHGQLDEILQGYAESLDNSQLCESREIALRAGLLGLGEQVVATAMDLRQERLRERIASVLCPMCCSAMKFKQMRAMQVRLALTGRPVEVSAPVAVCTQKCPVLLNMARHVLGLDEHGRTPRLRELAARAGAIEPFEHASANLLHEFGGIEMSANGIHGICQEVAQIAQMRMDIGELGDARTLKPGEMLYVMADGCMVLIDGQWREVKFGVIFPALAHCEVSKDRGYIGQGQVVCTLGDREDLGRMLWKAVARWLPKDRRGDPITNGKIIFISDGSLWLQHMCEQDLPGAVRLLDWYHMSQHVALAARELHPDNEVAARKWRNYLEDLAMSGRIEPMLDEIDRQRWQPGLTTSQRDELGKLLAYLRPRKGSMRYSWAKSAGYLIGSGPVESAANHAIQQRMKRAGIRWDRPGAAAMLALRAAVRSSNGFSGLGKVA